MTYAGDEKLIYEYYSPALLHHDTRTSMALPDLKHVPSRLAM